ncbi:hypothetical protein CVD28_06285 [Bacillus sp. M6-12]|uniref:hypothetical protein n=1 Tax=Bacillus sp. M6-12 TaxID=2054166 RepID=UPI000C75E62E|nr:hypothetical protein [Bacillus sp. M6-12]PLS18722.1 hypothetical protein CVD28_06285 [Bacillus sp. M6-12]
MSVSRYHGMCSRGIGRAVEIKMRDGRTHRGIIDRVTRDRVYLRPFGKNYGGYGYGWGFGFAAGFALGAIVSLAFIPFFW